MAHDDNTRRAVLDSFVHDALAIEAAAAAHGVPAATAKRWKQEEKKAGRDWDVMREKARAVREMTGDGPEAWARNIYGLVMQQTVATMEAIKNTPDMPAVDQTKLLASLADSQTKMASVMKKFIPEVDKASLTLETLKRLAAHAQEATPQHLSALAEILGGYAATEKLPLTAVVDDLVLRSRLTPQAGSQVTGGAEGLSSSAARQIRYKILGVKT